MVTAEADRREELCDMSSGRGSSGMIAWCFEDLGVFLTSDFERETYG